MTEPSSRARTRRPPETGPGINEVVLVGRVSAAPERRDLPSGDQLVTLRVVVDRPQKGGQKGAQRGGQKEPAKRAVDVIDVACWSKRTQRTASGLEADDDVRVEGSLRRRFFAAGGGRASRYEVEAARLVRVSRPAG
jgi:single-strand DNA-binding protein